MAAQTIHVASASDFAERFETLDLATPEEIRALAANSKTVFIDLRSEDEVAQKKLESHDFIHAPITYTDTSKITSQAEKLIPDKGTPVVVYCGAGRRGKVGKEALIYAGYTNVVNGGGLEDILRHLQE